MKHILLLVTAAMARATGSGPETHSREADVENRARAVDSRHIFSPRMDYDEWTPLGRGDPLKNDPTYDYVPPVLDRVHYWMDISKRTPDPPLPNADVMVLGTRTELPTTTIPASSRLGTMSLLDPFLKFMDASKASLGFSTPSSSNYFRPTPNPSYYPPPHHNAPPVYGPPQSSSQGGDYMVPPPPPSPPKGQALQRPPYTMLMPPPPPAAPTTAPTEAPMTSFGTSTRTTSEAEDVSATVPAMVTSASESVSEVTTTTTTSTTAAALTTILGSSENLYKPVAITMPESISNDSNEVFPTTPTPHHTHDGSMTLPIMSMFNENANHIPYQELKLPSNIIIPPPEKINDYFGFLPTTVRPTTTIRTLTTDPMFKHYKQPSEPVRGPFYLIIQGHSKVKTYGASKNKVKPLSSNEINFDDGKSSYDMDFKDNNRRERKLEDSNQLADKDSTEVVEGHPTIELTASFNTKGQTGFSVSDNGAVLEDLEEAFPKSDGGRSKKRILMNSSPNSTIQRRKRYISRQLLSKMPQPSENSQKPTLDEQQLGLESLIALNDDYNSEDVINLLLKEEGQGSGFGGFVASLFGGSTKGKANEEI